MDDVLAADIGAGGELHVLRDVHHHRAGAAVLGDIEGLVQGAREVVHVPHQVIVLGAGAGDSHRVAFLEGVVADEVGRHLPGDADDRDGIHQRIGEAGDGIGGAGAGGDEHHADLAGGAGIALGRMHRRLLVAHQDVLDMVLVEQRVVDRQHRAARIAEDVLDALVGEGLDHHLGAGHLLRHGQLPAEPLVPAGAAPDFYP